MQAHVGSEQQVQHVRLPSQEEQDEIRAKLDDFRAKETAATADVPALQEERVAAKAVVDAAYAKKSELYADFKARMDAWREDEKAWRVQRDEDRKIRYVCLHTETLCGYDHVHNHVNTQIACVHVFM